MERRNFLGGVLAGAASLGAAAAVASPGNWDMKGPEELRGSIGADEECLAFADKLDKAGIHRLLASGPGGKLRKWHVLRSSFQHTVLVVYLDSWIERPSFFTKNLAASTHEIETVPGYVEKFLAALNDEPWQETSLYASDKIMAKDIT